jgi:hypothetical protein
MSKRDKQRQPERRGVGLSSLRPRLDQWLRGEALPHDDQDALYEGLDALTAGIKPAIFLPTIIAAANAAPEDAQATLDELLPSWLSERDYLATLRDLVARQSLSDEQQQRALAWLAAAGADTGDLTAELAAWAPFYDAYYAGTPSQATLMIFWYTSHRKHRIQGMNVLLDFEPPWDGAVKDAMRYPQRTPEAAIEEFVDFWGDRGMAPTRLSAVEAKIQMLDALIQNRESNIRLHPDLVAAREQFIRYILSLPDGPDTPQFTAADFDFLAHHGENPEALRRQEQMFGYRARLPDGQEVHILRGPDDDDW